MGALLIQLYIALYLHGGEAMDGYAPRYDPGVMERVVTVRHLAPVACDISSAYYGVGTWVWVWSWNTKTLKRCRVSDVSDTTKKNGGESDQARHRRTRRIMEWSYPMAIEMCGREHLNDRPEACPVTVIKLNE